MAKVTAVIKDKTLIITIPMEEKVSGSGKSKIIASSGGNQQTTLEYNGKPVIIGINAYTKID